MGRAKFPPITAFVLIAALVLVMSSLIPGGNALSKDQIRQAESYSHLKWIGVLVTKYQDQHQGSFPHGLIDLCPYLDGDLSVFYTRSKPTSDRPVDWLTNTAKIDQYADFALPHDSNSKGLAFEKPGLWSDRTIGVCMRDHTIQRLTPTQFAALQIH